MPKQKLDHQTIKSFEAPSSRKAYFDTHTKGLALRVTPAGTKTFFYRYRFAKKNRRFTIGRFPDISLKEARNRVSELRLKVTNGNDPQAEKRKRRYKPQEITFRELAETFSKQDLPKRKPRTRKEYQRIIDNELLGEHGWGDIEVSEITSQHVREVLNHKAFEDDSFTMANRIRSTISKIFEFGLTNVGLKLKENPVTNTPIFEQGENVRERVYNEDEIKELWEFWETKPEPIQSVFKMLLICGQRKTETMRMKWADIEWDKPCKKIVIGNDGRPKPEAFLATVWTIRDNKSDRVHEVPLSLMALEILENLKSITGDSDYVFCSPRKENEPLKSIKSTSEMVKRDTSISDFRPHDLRRTLNTKLAEMLIDETVRKKILNHKVEGVNEKHYTWYNYNDQKKKALQRWSWRMESILAGETETKIHKIG
jgi:integrase